MSDSIRDCLDNFKGMVNQAVESDDFKNLKKNITKAVEPVRNPRFNDQRPWANVPPERPKRNWREENAGRPMNGGHMDGSGNAFRGTYRSPQYPGGQFPNTGEASNTTGGPSRNAGRPSVARNAPKVESAYFKNSSVGGAGVMFGLGLFGAIALGSVALISLIISTLAGFGPTFGGIFLGALAVASGLMSWAGSRRIRLLDRYEKYRKVLESKQFATVAELAASCGQSVERTKADLRKLTQEGYFKQGRFDAQEKNFIASDEMYGMYIAAEENAARLRREEAARAAEENAIPSEVRELLANGDRYIRRIHEANANIPDEGITDKLNRMEQIVTRIFAEVRTDPSLAKNLNMFMDYYLPTTIKLVGAYEDMDRREVQGENIQNAKAEIAGSLDVVNDAFEKLLDSFFADDALDVSTDISVLKSMMRQEGLTDDELTVLRKKQEMQAKMETGPTLSQMEEDIFGAGEANPEGLQAVPLGGEEDF